MEQTARMRAVFERRGFTRRGNGVVECWLDASARPPVSPLPKGYGLATRQDLTDRPHHMDRPHVPAFEERLRQTSLYRPDLDLVVLDEHDEPAAQSIVLHDPATAIGVVARRRASPSTSAPCCTSCARTLRSYG